MIRSFLLSTASAGVLVLSSGMAQAAGFYIQEQSVSGLGAAFSGSVTNLKDPSTIYFNPAGLTEVPGAQAQLGAHLLIPSADLEDTGSTNPLVAGGGAISGNDGGNPYDPTPVPNGYVSVQYDNNLWFGVGVSAPFGLANEYDDDWFGRYDSIKTELAVIDIQPTIAYKVNDALSVGAGLNIQYADAELTNAANGGAGEGKSTLKGDDTSLGFNVGVRYQPWESTVFAASYRSAVNHELVGTAKNEGTTTADFDVQAHADLNLPDIATFGVAHNFSPRWTVMGQATWFGWSSFQDITTVTREGFSLPALAANYSAGDELSSIQQGYENTWAFALGAEYMHDDNWTFRGGAQFDATPTVDEYRTSRTPDGDRTWASLGGTYNFDDRWSMDFAGTYIWIDDETIDVTRNNSISPAGAAEVEANTEGNVGIVALSFTYKF